MVLLLQLQSSLRRPLHRRRCRSAMTRLELAGLARSAVVIALTHFAHNLRRLATMARLQQVHAGG